MDAIALVDAAAVLAAARAATPRWSCCMRAISSSASLRDWDAVLRRLMGLERELVLRGERQGGIVGECKAEYWENFQV